MTDIEKMMMYQILIFPVISIDILSLSPLFDIVRFNRNICD